MSFLHQCVEILFSIFSLWRTTFFAAFFASLKKGNWVVDASKSSSNSLFLKLAVEILFISTQPEWKEKATFFCFSYELVYLSTCNHY